jgi:hypothetical protein
LPTKQHVFSTAHLEQTQEPGTEKNISFQIIKGSEIKINVTLVSLGEKKKKVHRREHAYSTPAPPRLPWYLISSCFPASSNPRNVFILCVRSVTVASINGLGVDVHFGCSAAVPGGEQHAAATALVLDILERSHEIGNETQAAGETADT